MTGPAVAQPARPPELDRVTVQYTDEGRVVSCFCGTKVSRSIVPHFKNIHPAHWNSWVNTFVRLRSQGYPLKRIMREFQAGDGKLLFSWTVIERAMRREVESGRVRYRPSPKSKIDRWEPGDFSLETTTVWDFPRRGDWAVHSGDYRGNWPPQLARNLILRYTKKRGLVVDAFAGGGTTLIEAWLLGRRGIGLDVSRLAVQMTSGRIREMAVAGRGDDRISLKPDRRPKVITADALRLSQVLRRHGVKKGQVKLLCAHPPYLDSLEYTNGDARDLATSPDPEVFLRKLSLFADEAHKVLAPGGVCAILIGDVRRNGTTFPLGLKTLQTFLNASFSLEHIVVKTQHRDRSSEFYVNGRTRSLLMAHEYLFILRG